VQAQRYSNKEATMLINYWIQFRDQFSAILSSVPDQNLKEAWSSSSARTKFYTNDLFPQLAKKLELGYTTELFKVDFALCAESSSGKKVPLIFIESENDASTAEHEMWKLCSLSAPLKVLVVCHEWSEEPDFWPHGGHKSKSLQKWSDIIKAHNEVWPQPSIYGVIIAEWHKTLRFYSIGFGSNGNELDPHKILIDRKIPLHDDA
jgi:hypothetical protein